jgi:hypothetical protein
LNGREDRPEIDVTIDARRFQGVWANAVRLDARADAFTLDSSEWTRERRRAWSLRA